MKKSSSVKKRIDPSGQFLGKNERGEKNVKQSSSVKQIRRSEVHCLKWEIFEYFTSNDPLSRIILLIKAKTRTPLTARILCQK